MLEKRIEVLELSLRQTNQQLVPLQNRTNMLDRLLRGGEGREFESLLFRVTFLEQLITVKKHIKPVSKKQMKEIRKLMKESKSHFYIDGREQSVDEMLGRSR
jgi:hypothetical protein